MTMSRRLMSATVNSTVATGGDDGNPMLAYAAPSRAVLNASPRKVLTHYFSTSIGPISVDDSPRPDYYESFWLPPGHLELFPGATDFRPVGGLMRDRPIYRAPRGNGYEQLDRVTDVQNMHDASLDGCVIDVLGLSGTSIWTQITGLYDAVVTLSLVGDFVCAPMFDMSNGSDLQSASQSQMVSAIQTLDSKPAAFKINGRLQITWFDPETKPASYYSSLASACANLPTPILIDQTMCYVEATSSVASTYNSVAARHGRWGDRDPVSCNDSGSQNRGGAQYIYDNFSKPYMAPVSPGDVRPNANAGNNWHEQRGTEQLRTSWDAAIFGNGTSHGQADWIQIPTWNDYSETANIAPSMLHGYALIDIGQYFITRYKTGTYPTIVRDALYLSHKSQFASGMTFTSPTFNNPMEHDGATAAADIVEVLAFVTNPTSATIEITTGGTTTVKSGFSAGLNAFTVPLRAGGAGSVSAVMKRNGSIVNGTTITSPWAVSTTAQVHDPTYRIGSSLRGWSATYPDFIPTQT